MTFQSHPIPPQAMALLADEAREANLDVLIRQAEKQRGLPKMTAGFIDGKFPGRTLQSIAMLIRGLPDIIEGCDVSEQLMLALDQIDAARALIEMEADNG